MNWPGGELFEWQGPRGFDAPLQVDLIKAQVTQPILDTKKREKKIKIKEEHLVIEIREKEKEQDHWINAYVGKMDPDSWGWLDFDVPPLHTKGHELQQSSSSIFQEHFKE